LTLDTIVTNNNCEIQKAIALRPKIAIAFWI